MYTFCLSSSHIGSRSTTNVLHQSTPLFRTRFTRLHIIYLYVTSKRNQKKTIFGPMTHTLPKTKQKNGFFLFVCFASSLFFAFGSGSPDGAASSPYVMRKQQETQVRAWEGETKRKGLRNKLQIMMTNTWSSFLPIKSLDINK